MFSTLSQIVANPLFEKYERIAGQYFERNSGCLIQQPSFLVLL